MLYISLQLVSVILVFLLHNVSIDSSVKEVEEVKEVGCQPAFKKVLIRLKNKMMVFLVETCEHLNSLN